MWRILSNGRRRRIYRLGRGVVPGLARSLGASIREFKWSIGEVQKLYDDETDEIRGLIEGDEPPRPNGSL